MGRWTFKLIPNIERWTDRKHGNLNFYLTQALTGHGVFNSFRCKIGKAESSGCWFHPEEEDSPKHTLFDCQEWNNERKILMEELDIETGSIQPEELMEKMLQKEKYWNSFVKFCKSVLSKKEEEERRRKKEEEEVRDMNCTDLSFILN